MNNNSKLTAAVQAITGQTKAQAEESIQSVLQAVKDVAVTEGKLTIQGYGTFSNTLKPAREGRNPRTGQAVTIPAREAFTFKGVK